MPRLRNKEDAAPSDDYGWRWGEPVEGNHNNVKCRFCGRFIKGGITRLKEHLAAKKGNVARYPHVSVEVRKTIVQHQEYHSEKAAKQRRKEELEERIRLGDRGDYGDSGGGDDEELTIARRESMISQVE
ncbi:hypothetical protein PVK06_017164 [Gossypium arboreum]|uniref:BED-type domain-containing protein n=1 Tax=Gossypium arboreum TaxID=29729 RepID=A0ABR0Q2F8_GOSAR|nr:hypothetical protein PVK06_017164 [Gossypium arboreum]